MSLPPVAQKQATGFFVVSESQYAYKYEKLGLTFTRKNVCKKLRSYF